MASNRVIWETRPELGVFATEPEFLGKFPVRTEIEVLPADDIVWCPLCERNVRGTALTAHCRKEGDRNHLALEVMET